jgi:sugar phosphate isomerase/epimerase
VKFPLDQALVMCNRVGLKHICVHPLHLPLDGKPDEIAKAAAKVRAAGLDFYGNGVVYMKTPADADRAFAFAKAVGLRTIIAMPMPELLPLLNEKVQAYDIRIAIHNHGPGDKVYPTPDVAYEKIKNLDPRMGLCIDIGHTMRIGADPSQAAERFADRLWDIHVKDVTAASKAGTCIEAGRGVIDLPKFFRTLDRIHYAGIVSFEFEKDPKDPLPGLAESVGYVRGVLEVI